MGVRPDPALLFPRYRALGSAQAARYWNADLTFFIERISGEFAVYNFHRERHFRST